MTIEIEAGASQSQANMDKSFMHQFFLIALWNGSKGRLTANQSHTCSFTGNITGPVSQLWAKSIVHLTCERACCTIPTRTFRVSP